MISRLICFLLFIPVFLVGQSFPDKPVNYITDESGVISEEQQAALNAKCRSFQDSSSTQIFVYVTPTLNGSEMQPLCQEIFHKWGIGQKGKNNGVLIAVFVNDHKFRIHTGYGMEGALPDLLTKKIQDEDMKPYFKEGDYYGGIDKGIDQLIYYSSHEFVADDSSTGVSDGGMLLIFYIVNLVLLVLLYFSSKKSTKSERTKKVALILGCVFALIPFAGIFLMFILFGVLGRVRSSSGGSYSYSSDSSSYSSSDSSSSSSDFGGGGGGDSGGGGSDSSW
jgi:uncharacterized protein